MFCDLVVMLGFQILSVRPSYCVELQSQLSVFKCYFRSVILWFCGLAVILDGTDDPATTPFLEIADQKGNPLKIPHSKKKVV